MNDRKKTGRVKGAYYQSAFLIMTALLLLAGGWWAGDRQAGSADSKMRRNLLQQTAGIVENINPELAQKLTFTAEDKGTPAFERIREQMISATGTIPNLRSIYSVAVQGEKIVFGPDNLALDDEDHAPPGDVYQSPPAELRQSLQNRKHITVGPYSDEWGTFISAFAPILDPHSGEVVMVVGVDILADDWQVSLNSARRGPLMVTLILILLLAAGTIIIRRRNRHMRPETLKFKVWIVIPSALAMLGALLFYGWYEYREFNEASYNKTIRLVEQTKTIWDQNIHSQVQILKAQVDHIAENPGLLKAWQDRDLASLITQTQLPFEQLKWEYNITRFLFITPERICFLRVHQRERQGDRIDRTTLLTAVNTGEDSWDSELGSLGAFTLRYVKPWKQNDKIIGYLELGMETEFLVNKLATEADLSIFTVIRKDYTTREEFEAKRQTFKIAGQWETYSDFVLAYQTGIDFPDEVASWLESIYRDNNGNEVFNTRQGERRFACGVVHLPDVAGRNVADIIVMRDVTAEFEAAWSTIFLNLSLTIILLGGVLALLWSVTGTVERQLRAVFSQVTESEEKHRALVEGLPDVVMRFDRDGRHLFVSENVRDMLDLQAAQFIGKTHRELGFPSGQCEFWEEAIRGAFERGTPIEAEFTLENKRGSTTYNWRLVPERDAQANVQSVLSLSRDMTAQRRAEQNYRTLFREMLDGFALHEILCDPQGNPVDYRFLAVNPAFERMTGLKADSIIGRTVTEVLPGIEQHWITTYGKVALTGEPVSFENYTNEMKRHFAVTAFRPAPKQFACIFVDITERKQAEEELGESREILNAILNSIPVRVFWKDRNLVYLGCNMPFARDAGFEKPEDIIGKDDHAMGWRDQAKRYQADDREVIEKGDARFLFEEPQTTPSGGQIHLLTSKLPLRDASGAIVGVLGTYFDITERKQAEEALCALSARQTALLSAVPDIIAEVDNNKVYTWMNQEGLRFFGQDAIGKEAASYFVDEQETYQKVQPLFGGNDKVIYVESWQRRHDGEKRLLAWWCRVLKESNGNVTGALSTARDITEYKQAEEERLNLERQVQQAQKLESLGVLAGGIAHDFNNILMAILGNAELARDLVLPTSVVRERITQITTAANRATELCRQMMAYSGKASFVREPVDLRVLIEEMASLLKVSISKKVEMNLNLADNLPPVIGDPSQLRQVVMNLITNASDAIGDKNGVIGVSLDIMDCDDDYLRGAELHGNMAPGSYIYIEVTDTGCGMNAETRARIFEPFFTTKSTGHGLGLAAIMGIIKTHKGTFKLASEPGKGTTFRVLFPAAEISPAIEAVVESSPTTDLVGNGLILLVDDEEMLLNVGRLMLERIGLSVITAANGLAAIDLYRERGAEIDIVIMDLTMPHMDGIEAFGYLHQLNPEVCVVITSGHTSEDLETCFEKIRPAAFLQKPYTVEKLKELLAGISLKYRTKVSRYKNSNTISAESEILS